VAPTTNSRAYVVSEGTRQSASQGLHVRFLVSLNVTKIGTRRYVFAGQVRPNSSGGLAMTIYRRSSSTATPVKVDIAATTAAATSR